MLDLTRLRGLLAGHGMGGGGCVLAGELGRGGVGGLGLRVEG